MSPIKQDLYEVTIFEKGSNALITNIRRAGRHEDYEWTSIFQKYHYDREGASKPLKSIEEVVEVLQKTFAQLEAEKPPGKRLSKKPSTNTYLRQIHRRMPDTWREFMDDKKAP